MNDTTKALMILTAVLAGTAATSRADDTAATKPAAKPDTKQVATDVPRSAPGVQGEKIEEVKSVNNGTAAVATKVEKGTVAATAAQAVPGVKGIDGAKMANLQKALHLAAKADGAPGGGAPGPSDQAGDDAPDAVAKLLDKKQKGKEPPKELEPKDGRDLPLVPPPNEAGGS